MKYLEQREKIIQAYYNDELDPFNSCACFIGNLLNNKGTWAQCRAGTPWNGNGTESNWNNENALEFIKIESNDFYKAKDIINLENNFLKVIWEGVGKPTYDDLCKTRYGMPDILENHANKENILFEAMNSTLDFLYQIHKENGDTSLDEKPILTKRILQIA